MYRYLMVSVAALAFGIGAAPAADLGAPAPAPIYTKAPLAVPFSWTGFYVGANLGYGFGSTTTTDIVATNSLCWVKCGAQWDTKVKGITGGAQAGYNWQFNSLVLGVEGDLGALDVNGNGNDPLLSTTFTHTNGGVFSTARGRLGFAIDHVLVYGTGGWFGANFDSSVHQHSGVLIDTSSTSFQSGWTAGAGGEWAFAPRWSLKGEWLHYDVGNQKVGGVIPTNVTQFFNIKNTGDIVRGGINYHF